MGEKRQTDKEPHGKMVPIVRSTGWRPVSFFGEGLEKRKARRVYEGRGGLPYPLPLTLAQVPVVDKAHS